MSKATQPKFKALGQKVSTFTGFETFPAPPGVRKVRCVSDEVTANCPVTNQPDWYTVDITYHVPGTGGKCIESKSLKLFLQSFRDQGLFCEAFAARIAKDISVALGGCHTEVTVSQKPRGGVAIHATATQN